LRLVLARQRETHSSAASFNNHWGVPLSLARLPESAHFAVFEIGMNHAGEVTPLTRLIRPHVAIITAVEPVHLEFFDSVEAIADAKAEIFLGLEAGGAAVINRDSPLYGRLARAAQAAGVTRIVSFGEHPEADARLLAVSLQPADSSVHANILGNDVVYKLGAPGRHLVINSLAVLAAAALVGADLAIAALALGALEPPSGRGQRIPLQAPSGAALLIDESYNANPASMRAALALLGQTPVGRRGRRIAVLGDMLELGTGAAEFHRQLVEPIVSHAVDLVFCAGPLMRALWDKLPPERRGGHAETSALLEADVLATVRGGDVIMVKGSLGSRMGPIAQALARRFRNQEAATPAAVQG
jgi:UDP-N-acetylmuramoyl-tripeptide--D-alanyl-D-alanine ligase